MSLGCEYKSPAGRGPEAVYPTATGAGEAREGRQGRRSGRAEDFGSAAVGRQASAGRSGLCVTQTCHAHGAGARGLLCPRVAPPGLSRCPNTAESRLGGRVEAHPHRAHAHGRGPRPGPTGDYGDTAGQPL